MSLRPLFFTRGKTEVKSHGEEKEEEELESEDLKRASPLRQRYQGASSLITL
jgi:hypothetical protein